MLPVSFPGFGAFQLSHAIKKPKVMLMQTNSEGCRATQNAVIYILWQHRQCCNILPEGTLQAYPGDTLLGLSGGSGGPQR